MPPLLIDSNSTGLSFAEEVSLKVLPGTPVWWPLEPNSYPSDFGAKYTSVARSTINSSRQQLKGTLTGLEASAAFQSDFVQNALQRITQGFFFAKMRQKPSTAPMNGAAIVLTALTSTQIQAAAGLNIFLPGHIVLLSNFITANNRPFVLSAATAGALTTTGLIVDGAPPAAANVQAVGFQFAAGDVSIVTTNVVTLSSTVADFTTLGLITGEFVFIGGDTAISQFATGTPGYARILTVSAHQIVFDFTYLPVMNDTGAGKTIQMFFGNVLKNELVPNIVRTTYTLERQLGSDGVGMQAEYVLGCVPNQMTLTLNTASKATVDYTFVGMDVQENDGTTGILGGTRQTLVSESPFNTSQAIYAQRLYVIDPTTSMPTALYGYLSDAKIVIDNKVSGDKALGILGNIEASTGDFEATSTFTAYFATVDAAKAIRNNANAAVNLIFAQNNSATIVDIPLLMLGDGAAKVEKDKKVMISVSITGARNNASYTALMNYFPYLPTIAMPV